MASMHTCCSTLHPSCSLRVVSPAAAISSSWQPCYLVSQHCPPTHALWCLGTQDTIHLSMLPGMHGKMLLDSHLAYILGEQPRTTQCRHDCAVLTGFSKGDLCSASFFLVAFKYLTDGWTQQMRLYTDLHLAHCSLKQGRSAVQVGVAILIRNIAHHTRLHLHV